MALSRLARELAGEIACHDWSDAPYRADQAGHRREFDQGWESKPRLDEKQTAIVRMNVMWVVGQVLGYAGLLAADDIYEWAEACGVDTRTPSGKPRSGGIRAGFRMTDDQFDPPSSPAQHFISADDGPWDEIDFADPTPIAYATAVRLWTMWLTSRGVKKALPVRALAAYVQERCSTADAKAVPLGDLRGLFVEYYQRNHTEHSYGP